MLFEHLIEINDLHNPFSEILTKEQLWAGILYRVEDPLPFLPGLESCEILARGENWVERRLEFGPISVQDRVTLTPSEIAHFAIAPSENHPGGSLTIAIEARTEVDLFLRFAYQNNAPIAPEDTQYIDYVKAAYKQSDLDMVQKIRELASEGKLSTTLH